MKRPPPEQVAALPEAHRRDPIRLRDLIAHRYFALDPSIIHDAATHAVPELLMHARALRDGIADG
jgi:uncharacterized protein with HEPN domain